MSASVLLSALVRHCFLIGCPGLLFSGRIYGFGVQINAPNEPHTGEKDPRMEMTVLKTVAGFLNTKGGTLVIGVVSVLVRGVISGAFGGGFPAGQAGGAGVVTAAGG